jgi:cyclin T
MMTMMCVDVQDVYDIEKEKVLLGERLVFTTLDFNINIHHPYKPLAVAIRKLQVITNTLCTSCMEFCE